MKALTTVLYPKQVMEEMQMLLQANINFMLVGRPGIGKTEMVKAACAAAGIDIVVAHPAIESPVDYKGMPCVIDGKAYFLPFANLEKLIYATKPTLFFADDLGQASATVQAALMQLIQGREVAGHKVSEHVIFGAATNRREDNAGVSGLLNPVMDRFAIFHVDTLMEDWVEWALGKDYIPNALIAAVRFKRELVEGVDEEKDGGKGGRRRGDIANVPTPRGLERIGRIMTAKGTHEGMRPHYEACIGAAASLELDGFMRKLKDLPPLSAILADPENCRIPTEASSMYGMIGALVSASDSANVEKLITYVSRFSKEFQVLFMKDLRKRDPKLTMNAVFISWAQSNAELFKSL